MKFRYFSIIIGIALIFSACDDVVVYNDGYDNGLTPAGPPSISFVSPVAYVDSVITSGELGQMVVIHGENLSQVQSIRFNDQLVDLNSIYAVNKRITVPIPSKEPDEITDVLEVVTSKGKITYTFEVKFPPLMITGFSHDFANQGEWMDIYGRNFLIYGLTPENAVIKINGIDAKVESSSETAIRIIIPAGITDNAKMTISGEKLVDRLGEEVELTYRDRGYEFVDLGEDAFEHPATKEYATTGSNPGDPKPLLTGKNFLRMNKETEAWSWNFILNFYGFDLDLTNPLVTDMKVNAAGYELKYEIYVPTTNPITNPDTQLIVALKNNKSLPDENDVSYPAEATSLFQTDGRWLTMRLADGEKYIKSDGSTILVDEENNLAIAVTNSSGVPVTLDVSLANFRFVKKINISKVPKSSN